MLSGVMTPTKYGYAYTKGYTAGRARERREFAQLSWLKRLFFTRKEQ